MCYLGSWRIQFLPPKPSPWGSWGWSDDAMIGLGYHVTVRFRPIWLGCRLHLLHSHMALCWWRSIKLQCTWRPSWSTMLWMQNQTKRLWWGTSSCTLFSSWRGSYLPPRKWYFSLPCGITQNTENENSVVLTFSCCSSVLNRLFSVQGIHSLAPFLLWANFSEISLLLMAGELRKKRRTPPRRCECLGSKIHLSL